MSVHGDRFALWRGQGGQAAAVVNACPHREAPLSRGRVTEDGRIACAYHGWRFDAEGQGFAPSQPSLKCQTRALRLVEKHGYLWLASGSVPEASIADLQFEGFVPAGCFQTRFETPIHIAIDNFTEDEHFASIHAILGWSERDWDKVQYEGRIHDDRTEAWYSGPQRPSPVLPILGVQPGDTFHNHFESRFDPIRHVYTSHWTDSRGKTRPIEAKTAVYMVPYSDRVTMLNTFVFIRTERGSLQGRLQPLMKIIAKNFVRLEWHMDGRWVRHLADTAKDLRGLRLGKYDKTVIRNRKLLEQVYFGEGGRSSSDERSSMRRLAMA